MLERIPGIPSLLTRYNNIQCRSIRHGGQQYQTKEQQKSCLLEGMGFLFLRDLPQAEYGFPRAKVGVNKSLFSANFIDERFVRGRASHFADHKFCSIPNSNSLGSLCKRENKLENEWLSIIILRYFGKDMQYTQ